MLLGVSRRPGAEMRFSCVLGPILAWTRMVECGTRWYDAIIVLAASTIVEWEPPLLIATRS